VEHELSELLRLTTRPPTLELVVSIGWPLVKDDELQDQVDEEDRVDHFDARRFLSEALVAKRTTQHGLEMLVPITKTLLITSELYHVLYDSEDEKEDIIGEMLEQLEINHVFYKASLSEDDCAWRGLDLEVVEAGHYDYERAVRYLGEFRAGVHSALDAEYPHLTPHGRIMTGWTSKYGSHEFR